jgi:hypothetical protein
MVIRNYFTIHMKLSYPAGNQLCILGTKIKNENLLHLNDLSAKLRVNNGYALIKMDDFYTDLRQSFTILLCGIHKLVTNPS